EEWAIAPRERWRELYLNALSRLAEWYAKSGQYQRAIEQCQRVITLKPSSETIYRQKMLYHAWATEPNAALETYQLCVNALKEHLEVEPSPETKTLYEKILQGEVPPPKISQTNLPASLTSFIGREQELQEIMNLLIDVGVERAVPRPRLLTLTGFGGTGKTRLAQKAAWDLLEEFPDGVWWVRLAVLTDPALVPQAVASALGLREEPNRPLISTLIDYLRSKNLLLVLDNGEHVVEACASLAETLLQNCPQLRILATSREALGVHGEIAWLVPSLSLPDLARLARGGIDLSALRQYEAVRLFAERAAAAQPNFSMTDRNASAIAYICQRLDGIPLAIELAAAKVRVLSIEQIAERLENDFRLLTNPSRTALPKDQTLRAALDWSHNLLSEKQKTLFRRLSVFVGGCVLEAVEAVCADDILGRGGSRIAPTEILELLTQLIDKSLVTVEDHGDVARYRMLETIRHYGQQKLSEQSEPEVLTLRARHRDWFLALAERAEAELLGARQTTWLSQLEQEYDNLRAALRWSLENDEQEAHAALRLSGALGPFWLARSHIDEGSRLLEEALSKGQDAPLSARAKALLWVGTLARHLGDDERVQARCEESLSLFTELKNRWGMAFSLRNLGVVAQHRGDFERAVELHQRSLSLCREMGDAWSTAWSLHNLGVVARQQGNYQRVEALCGESLALFRTLGDKWGIAASLHYLGEVAEHKLEYANARDLHRESLLLYKELGDKRGIAASLNQLAEIVLRQENYECAATLFGAAEALRETINAPLSSGDHAEYERHISIVSTRLGPKFFDELLAQGRAMTLEQAVAYALENTA
ncbi:tetratricopeptide repeat protein, partial [Candidatus Acetothermia bacterium]|nr:tetratricopeptide repeat protein [Candidatus Acetothermia bacterium]